ncbi:hypothetical protein C2W62_23100 [Candidatus Entotheonella serta]|nr:hypothetical protein C2W62_23100 [Candidatus Entotheonella serta]
MGHNPSSLAVADVNLDGTLDLVTADEFSNTVSALFGEGDGAFPAAQGYGVGSRPQAVAADDLDSDGRLDLVTANASSDDVSVLLRQFKGSFVTVLNIELSDSAFGPRDVVIADLENGDAVLDLVTANAGVEANPSTTVSTLFGVRPAGFRVENFDAYSMRQGAVAVGDLNGDTLPDLVTASLGTEHEPANRVYVLLSQGLERYELLHAPAIQVDTGPQDVELGDFSGDGVLDLVTANANADTVSVILGRSNGNFNVGSRRNIAVGRRPVAVAIEDLNNDGRLDLVTANADDHNVSVLFGQGNGNFVPADPPEFAAGVGPSDVAVDDLAGVLGGGAPGLYVVTANANSNNVAVLKIREGVGSITLSAPQFFSVGTRPISVQVADFNADGRPDLITANEDSDNVSVLLQRDSADGECLFTP